jgi:hypothetical protein
MSYYILPKKNIEINIDVSFVDEDFFFMPIISNSLFYYLNDMYTQYEKIKSNELINLNKIVNPYEFIHSNVPNTQLSVSKIKAFSNTFYIYIEIINMLNLIDFFDTININTISYGKNSTSVMECLNLLREDYDDIKLEFKEIDNTPLKKDLLFNVHFLSYDINNNDYDNINSHTISLMHILYNILCYQSPNGVSIIKIYNIFYKPILDILYILTSMYEKIYIIKPNVSNVISNEKFIVCKNYIYNENKYLLYENYLKNLSNIFLKKSIIKSIINYDLPSYFLNKIEEANIIIGNQQIEYFNYLFSLYNSKNKIEKSEILKKNNIHKCIQWCEKFKIPNNKFIEKLNIFMNLPYICNNSNNNNDNKNNKNNNELITCKYDNFVITINKI